MDLIDKYWDLERSSPDRESYRVLYPEPWEWLGEHFDSIDTLAEKPAEALFFVGGSQEDLERLVTRYGGGIKRLILSRCPKVADLSPLEDLPDLERLSLRWNQRATRLWDLSKNKRLQGLTLDDFTRLHSLEGIQAATSLEYLSYGNGVWTTAVLDGLEPLLDSGISAFGFNGKKIERNDITIYPKVKTLRELYFTAGFYTTEQLAWLAAHGLEGFVLRPYIRWRENEEGREDVEDIKICGKRKPCLNSIRDAARIRKYEERFEVLVAQYRADPEAPPPA